MNIDTIYHSLLERSFNNDTADQFTELTEKYPYCQALHFARLKWIKENKQVEYNDYLKHVAAYAGDREYLYSLINDKVPSIDVKNSSDQFQIVQPEIKKEVGPGPAIIDDGEDRLQQIIDQRLRELNLVR